MKTRFLIASMLLAPVFALAQDGTPPAAGLTPESPLYVFDRLGEFLQELIAFSPETKIRLQIGFAAERIAEIQVEMKEKNVDAKGLSRAQERLENHLAKAARLVADREDDGEDVSEFEEMLESEIEVSKKVLESSFEAAKDALEDEREALKEELELAKKSGDMNNVEELKDTLLELESEKDELEAQREDRKESLESRIEESRRGGEDDSGDESEAESED